VKRLLIVSALLAVTAVAATCTVINVTLTTIGSNDTFGGELKNDSGVNILEHNVLVAFFNGSNELQETKNATVCLRSLPNGKSNYFSARSSRPAAETVNGLARLNYDSLFKVGNVETGNVTISNLRFVRNGTNLNVEGRVKNNDATQLRDPAVCVVVFNNNDSVILVGRNDGLADLSQNATSNFLISLTVPDSSTVVDRVDVFVDGLKNDIPIEPKSQINNSVSICAATAVPTATRTPRGPTSRATRTAVATKTPLPLTATPTATLTPALC
jgi:hypothetical protein